MVPHPLVFWSRFLSGSDRFVRVRAKAIRFTNSNGLEPNRDNGVGHIVAFIVP